jgi:hypothetical protein
MRQTITATGTVSIFVVLDMKQFIAKKEDQIQFDSLRDGQAMLKTLRNTWPARVQGHKKGSNSRPVPKILYDLCRRALPEPLSAPRSRV